MARARPKVLTLTDAAAERVKAIMARSETPVAGLRVGVKKGGCAGMEYTMEYAAEVRPIDEVVEDKGVRILIVESDYYQDIADTLLTGAKRALDAAGAAYDVVTVPGALEIPQAIAIMRDELPFGIGRMPGLEPSLFGLVLVMVILFEPGGMYGRWIKLKHWFQAYPLKRRTGFRRQKSYARSERLR